MVTVSRDGARRALRGEYLENGTSRPITTTSLPDGSTVFTYRVVPGRFQLTISADGDVRPELRARGAGSD